LIKRKELAKQVSTITILNTVLLSVAKIAPHDTNCVNSLFLNPNLGVKLSSFFLLKVDV